VGIRPDAPVTFKSGLRAPVYVDNRRLIFHPQAWHIVVEALAAALPASPAVEVIAGVESAGIPHSSALSFATGLPSVFVRKEAREHGLGRRVEGGDVAGRQTLLVEDMVTTGGSSLSAVAALREAGATVGTCLAIITYGFPEATRAFADASVDLHVLTTFESVIEEALASGRLDSEGARVARSWLADPHGWAP
jgi:orotate phosphoribosyltransferase